MSNEASWRLLFAEPQFSIKYTKYRKLQPMSQKLNHALFDQISILFDFCIFTILIFKRKILHTI